MKSPLIHLMLVILLCVATMAGYWFWYTVVEDKSAAAALLESRITANIEVASRIASARASLVEISGDEARMHSYFVSETGVVSFINNLEAQGDKPGATVSVLSVAAGDDAKRPTLTFAVTIKGNFDAVMRTVGAIEYAPYALSISTLAVRQDSKSGWHADLNLVVGSVAADVATSTL